MGCSPRRGRDYHRLMELMERLTRFPWGSVYLGATLAIGLLVAIGLGAPGWIFVPVSWAGITIFQLMKGHVDRHTGRRRY